MEYMHMNANDHNITDKALNELLRDREPIADPEGDDAMRAAWSTGDTPAHNRKKMRKKTAKKIAKRTFPRDPNAGTPMPHGDPIAGIGG
jgi:hypothetical protein